MSTLKKKLQQMTAFDRLEITADGYILYDKASDDEGVLIEDSDRAILPDIGSCIYCSTSFLRIQGSDSQPQDHRLLREYCL
jgi:hypothetical protein